jgi:hypothetical protein
VREFSPAREEEVIVMQQVTEIYGRENGWIDSARHSEHQIHPPPQVLEARVVAEGLGFKWIIGIELLASSRGGHCPYENQP